MDGWYLEPRTVRTLVLEDWDRLDLWPEASRADALLMVQDILVAASRRGISSLDQICGADARAVVADVAGVARLGATRMVAERERVRPVRNTLLSVLGTAALTLDAGIRTADSSLILDLTSGQWTRCDA